MDPFFKLLKDTPSILLYLNQNNGRTRARSVARFNQCLELFHYKIVKVKSTYKLFEKESLVYNLKSPSYFINSLYE